MTTSTWAAPLLAALVVSPVACDGSVEATPIGTPGSGVVNTGPGITRTDKADILVVVDNSSSMADKQAELARRMPELIAAITEPGVNPLTGKRTNLIDVHVGVITTSLGSHGTSACAVDFNTTSPMNDRGHLLPRAGDVPSGGYKVATPTSEPVAAPCPTLAAATPLTWVFDPTRNPGGIYQGAAGEEQLQIATSCAVASAKESGCRYEETWEALYHFLVDPAPYETAKVLCTFGEGPCGNNKIDVQGVDAELLAQRRAFLRPDSIVAVIILTDENDVSLKPAGLNWYPYGLAPKQMARGWSACANVPDDFEPETGLEFSTLHTQYGCFSCWEDMSDPSCATPWPSDPINADVDGRNVRGFHMVQRYGYNFLWGRQRYVDAFRKHDVLGSDGKSGRNPLFADGLRALDQVIVAAIVGVPKGLLQDATGKLLPQPLSSANWDLVAGPLAKRDPHMVESIAPRPDLAKFVGDRSVDPVNGGDRDVLDGDDLQYACISPRAVGTEEIDIDCQGVDMETKNPLCGPGGKQPYFKAYPGLRHLRIVRELGASGFVASICNESYRGAAQAVAARIRAAIDDDCIRSDITAKADGETDCLIVESMPADTFLGQRCEELGPGLCTPGASPCRRAGDAIRPPVSVETAAAQLLLSVSFVDRDGALRKSLPQQPRVENGSVVVVAAEDGKKHRVCELMQLAGGRVARDVTNACIHDPAFTPPSGVGGWCFSTELAVVGERCVERKSLSTIRFFGAAEPKPGAELHTLCVKPG